MHNLGPIAATQGGCLLVPQILLAVFLVLASAGHSLAEEPEIVLWYGDEQHFGHLGGHPQRGVNLLGSAQPAGEIAALQFSLNGGPMQSLSFHEDYKRIAKDGDFNIEIDRKELRTGVNRVQIEMMTREKQRFVKDAVIHYKPDVNGWPLPYSIDWSRLDSISDAAQVVDGKWKLTRQGVRSVERYYDRVLAFGDATWRDYEVQTTITIHALTAPKTKPNTTNVTHAAIALRWPGHDPDGQQPTVKWHPLGATGEFRLGGDLQACRWRIFDGQRVYHRESTARRTLKFETAYAMKHRVETLPNGTSRYRAKLWPADKPEPPTWDLTRDEPQDDVPKGSALLLAHHSDVTFGNVRVVSLREK